MSAVDRLIPSLRDQEQRGPGRDVPNSGRCSCDAASRCPLGRVGSQPRCYAHELLAVFPGMGRLFQYRHGGGDT